MVDFGNTYFDTKLPSSVPIVEPVRDQSSERFAQGLNAGLGNAIDFYKQDQKDKTDAALGSLQNDIVEKMSLLADARDQGKISLSGAARQVRVWSNEWVSNNPQNTEDIFKLINTLGADRGIAGSVYSETPEETGTRQKWEGAAKEGWNVSTPEGRSAYDNYLVKTNNLKIQAQNIEQLKQNQAEISETMKSNFQMAAQDAIISAYPWVQMRLAQADAEIAKAPDVASKQAIIDQTKNEINAQVGATVNAAGLSGMNVDYLTGSVNKLMESWEGAANGTSTKAAYSNAIETMKLHQQLLNMSDPEYGALYVEAANAEFRDPVVQAKFDKLRYERAAALSVKPSAVAPDGTPTYDGKIKPPDVVDKVENIAVVLENERNTITNLLSSDNVSQEAVDAMNNNISNTLYSVARNGAGERDATNFNAVVNYFADPQFGQWMEAHFKEMNTAQAEAAATILDDMYSNTVIELVNDRWTSAGTSLITSEVGSQMQAVDMADVAEPVWNGRGIEFQVKPEFADNAMAVGVVSELNQGKDSVTGPINKLIRMAAHLSGSTDYEKVYNESLKGRLWKTGKPANSSVDPGENLNTLSNIPPEALKSAYTPPPAPKGYAITPSTKKGQVGKLLDAIGKAEGANYDTLFGYAEQKGPFAGTQITDMTIDEVQALQKLMVKSNGISGAVGKYQFITPTLNAAVKALGYDVTTTKFTPEVQDALAMWLLQNRTSFSEWLMGSGDHEKFQNELASQWASIPDITGKSVYAGDGINKASAAGQELVGLL